MKRISSIVMAVLVIVAISGCMGSMYRRACGVNTTASYEEFLRKYPQGDLAREANQKLDGLYFEQASADGSITALETALKKRPNSSRAQEIRLRLAVLCEDRDWALVNAHPDDVNSCETFLRRYPASTHAADARSRLISLHDSEAWESAKKSDLISGYESFLKNRPQSPHADEARARLEDLCGERDWVVTQTNDTVEGYADFLSRHPSSPRSQEATSRRLALQKYDTEWKELMGRPSIQGLKSYCTRNPNSPYLPQARQAVLEMGTGRDIVDLVNEGKIEIEAHGSGIERVAVRLRKLVPYPVKVLIPVGSFFASANSSTQNMVTTAGSHVNLTSDDWYSVTPDAACANRPRHIPERENGFTVQRIPEQAELARLMPALDRAQVDIETRQAAVWIVTDNADYADLGILVAGYGGWGGSRVINEREAARAMKICDEEGINITMKAIWGDRQAIASELPNGALRKWMSGK